MVGQGFSYNTCEKYQDTSPNNGVGFHCLKHQGAKLQPALL